MSFPPRWPTSPSLAASATPRESSGAPPSLSAEIRATPVASPVVERVEAEAAETHRVAWLDLMARALEPQVFFDPDFVLPAARHLSRRGRPGFVLVWSDAARRELIGVCPLVDPPDPIRALASVWRHDLATLAIPLLDATRAEAALRALLAWAERGLPRSRGLVVSSLPADGPTARTLRAAAGPQRAIAVLDRWDRAVLRRVDDGAGTPGLSAKGAKEARRQRRRLAELGRVAAVSAHGGEGLRQAVEGFLALEASGWKGVAGTALLDRAETTAFARTATAGLGARALCRVETLTLDGDPIAAAVVLRAGDRDFLWKIAYREDLARYSPGVQLVLEITAAQLRDDRVSLTDSCAVPGHPMIDRLWRDRLTLVDWAVATRPGRPIGFTCAVAAERLARRMRGVAKRAVIAWRLRRGGVAPSAPGIPSSAPGAPRSATGAGSAPDER